jgi:hypothetical protein
MVEPLGSAAQNAWRSSQKLRDLAHDHTPVPTDGRERNTPV